MNPLSIRTPPPSVEYLFIHTPPTPLQIEPDRFGVVLKMVTRACQTAVYNNILSVRLYSSSTVEVKFERQSAGQFEC